MLTESEMKLETKFLMWANGFRRSLNGLKSLLTTSHPHSHFPSAGVLKSPLLAFGQQDPPPQQQAQEPGQERFLPYHVGYHSQLQKPLGDSHPTVPGQHIFLCLVIQKSPAHECCCGCRSHVPSSCWLQLRESAGNFSRS